MAVAQHQRQKTSFFHSRQVHDQNRTASRRAALLIVLTTAGMAALQIATSSSQDIQDFMYVGYFIPIFLAARYFSRRVALGITGAILLLYTAIFAPRFFTDLPDHPELYGELASRWILFVAAGFALTSFRLGIAKEKERALAAERLDAERLRMMLDISDTVSSTLKINQVLQLLAVRMVEAADAAFCRISLVEGGSLRVAAAFPVRNVNWDPSLGGLLPLQELPDHQQALHTRRPVIVDSDGTGASLTHQQQGLMRQVRSLLLFPLVAGDQPVGVVDIGERERWDRGPAGQDRINLYQTIVNQAAVAVSHALVHEQLEGAFVGTIRALAEAIDAKDASTRGHSDWVSKYAVNIGRQLGLPESALDDLRYAGYLHDVGKIGIPDTLLGKPGKLDPDEWRQMKNHPIVSARIIDPVDLSPRIKNAVRYHHERFDGNGYPDGLMGESIPLEARIMSVADAFEAMTSDRPYRRGLGEEEALAELKRHAGTQFDPVCVDAFLEVMKSRLMPLVRTARHYRRVV